MTTEKLARLINDIVREMMSHPNDVLVQQIPMDRLTALKIDVHPSEVGRVIGEKGAHFKALEKICLAFAHKNRLPVELMPMIEPDGATPSRYGKFKGKTDWRKQAITELLIRTAKAVFKQDGSVEVSCREMPNFVSVFTVNVGRSEDQDVVALMRIALKAIFNAVGRANGRVVMVDIVADGSGGKKAPRPPMEQPPTAAGRFADEVQR